MQLSEMKCKDNWSHNFAGNICINCGISQLSISGKELKKVEHRKEPKKRNITSSFQLLVQDTLDYLHEDTKNFAMFAGVIHRIGELKTRQIISYMRDRQITNSHYFMAMTRKSINLSK
jgi:predicted transcriptional regulator YheO